MFFWFNWQLLRSRGTKGILQRDTVLNLRHGHDIGTGLSLCWFWVRHDAIRYDTIVVWTFGWTTTHGTMVNQDELYEIWVWKITWRSIKKRLHHFEQLIIIDQQVWQVKGSSEETKQNRHIYSCCMSIHWQGKLFSIGTCRRFSKISTNTNMLWQCNGHPFMHLRIGLSRRSVNHHILAYFRASGTLAATPR